MSKGELPALTERFLAGVALAIEVHGRDRRTGTEIPYLAHLLVVTGLVVEDGVDEDQAIAAMLHDAVEDGGGRAMLERIARGFGPRVAAIVEACSDSVDVDPRESWIERKRRYLEHLPGIDDDAILRVALADKVHNARSIVRDYREEGHALWDRFTQKTARDQLWYCGGLLAFFARRRPGPLTEDLRGAVDELAWLVACDDAQRTDRVRLWLDADLHRRQAPPGWVQVRTAQQAIAMLADHDVRSLSLDEAADARDVLDWLSEQADKEGRDRWPADHIAVHGEPRASTIESLGTAIARRSRFRPSGTCAWARATRAADDPAVPATRRASTRRA